MATNSPPPSAVPPVSSPPSNTSPPPSQSSSPSPPSNSSPPPLRSSSLSPPPSNTSPPPSQSSSPPLTNLNRAPPPASPSQPNATPPDPATQSSPPVASSAPPPQPPPSPPPSTSPPPRLPPSPPPSTPSPPPPQQPISPASPPPPSNDNSPPPSNPPPPPSPVSNPPTSSPPPPSPVSNPPTSSPPPTPSRPPPSPPPTSPPPQPPANPPNNSTPPRPPTAPPKSSPPPSPAPVPPQSPSPASPPPPPVAGPPSDGSPPPKRSPSAPPVAPLPPPSPRLSPPSPSSQSPAAPSPINGSIPSSPGSTLPSNNNGIGTVGLVAIAVAAGIIVCSLIGLAIWCFRKRRKEVSAFNGVYGLPSPMGSSPRSDSSAIKTHSSAPLIASSSSASDFLFSPKEPGGLGNSRSLFTYEELVKATNGFSAQNLLGEGGFGSVYKGYLPDGREVAIKQLKVGGGQGEREFKAEVEIISRIHHRHLVSLVGYCISENRRLLIYDYVSNNNLYFHLHGEGRPVLEWATRVKVAIGAARGIAYLHEDCHPRIIHRDIKSSNILLDDNFEAKVSDFGLAKLALDANTHVTTRVMGTFGYMAPEYASSGKLTDKSDVFSFGVVLLELITGRKPVDVSQPLGDESLVEWARPLLGQALENEEFDSLVDPRLGKNYVDSEMFQMIEAAAACVRHSAAKRPRMGQVARAFDGLAAPDLTNGMRVGESEIYNTAQQSAEIRWFRRVAFGSQNYSTDFFTHGSSDND